MEACQENMGDELLRDENNSTYCNSENEEINDDKISISSVEETSKLQKPVKQKFVPSKLTSFSILFQSKPILFQSKRDLLIRLARCTVQSNGTTVSTDAGVGGKRQKKERSAAHKSDIEKLSFFRLLGTQSE